jgi:N-acetylneuraminic acid mutarotase
MFSIRVAVVASLLAVPLPAAAQDAARPASSSAACWSSLASPASPHRYHAVVALDGKIYAVGGDPSAAFEVYDPQRGAWTTLPPMPEPRLFLAAAALNGRIYVLGGWHAFTRASVARVDEYDVARQTWTRRADMPTARDRLAAVIVDGKILAIGGFDSNRNLDVVEVYDPTLDRWFPGPALPVARHGHSAVEMNGSVFVLGGYETIGTLLVSPLARTDLLDRQAGTWKQQANLPYARGFFAAAVLGQFIYAMGGRMHEGGAPVERYDTATQAWEVVGQMPLARQRFGAGAVNGKIIVVGGEETPMTAAIFDPLCTGKGS